MMGRSFASLGPALMCKVLKASLCAARCQLRSASITISHKTAAAYGRHGKAGSRLGESEGPNWGSPTAISQKPNAAPAPEEEPK